MPTAFTNASNGETTMRTRLIAILVTVTCAGCAGGPADVETTSAALTGTAMEFVHEPNGNIATSHPDWYVSYLSWDGSSWCAALYGTTFLEAPACNWSQGVQFPVLTYKAWDGSNWTAQPGAAGTWQFWPGTDMTQTHTTTALNYKASNGANWTMRLPDQLLHAPNGDFT